MGVVYFIIGFIVGGVFVIRLIRWAGLTKEFNNFIFSKLK